MQFKEILNLALKEDIGKGDVTTAALFPGPIRITAKILAKEKGIICGIPVVEKVFKALDKRIAVIKKVRDGGRVRAGQTICIVKGDARGILTGERLALNFLGRLSGIATLTRKYVERSRPYKVKIMDTRKTTPGLRGLEKYAVKAGGGSNHRMGLFDQVLIKDNHIKVYSVEFMVYGKKKPSLSRIIEDIREKIKKGMKIEIEVENLKQFEEVLKAKPDIIMLDNMSIADIKKAVTIKNNLSTINYKLSTKLEASGGITINNVRNIAKTGVDMISIGALTHSAKSLDLSLEVI